MARSLMLSLRFAVIMYVAEVAIAIAATATTVSKRLLRTGVIARLSRNNRLNTSFIFGLPHKKNFNATKLNSIIAKLCFNPALIEPSPIFPATKPPKKP